MSSFEKSRTKKMMMKSETAKKKRAKKKTTRATQSDHRVIPVVHLSFAPLESIATTSQDRRRFLSEARATPRLLSGTTINSSTVTSESSTWYSSTSRTVSGGLKFHCWRTMSRNERPPSGDHRKTNSWVRFIAVSSKTSAMRVSLCG